MIRARRPSEDKSPAALYLLEYDAAADADADDDAEKSCCCCCCRRWKCCVIVALLITVVLALLAFLLVFVAVPLTLMFSVDVQRALLFPGSGSGANNYANFRKYGVDGGRNLYVQVTPNVTLGAWHLLPLKLVYEAVTHEEDNYDYARALRDAADDDTPVLLYFHDVTGDRTTDRYKYAILRRFFHVIAFDYRGYGDSSPAVLTETGIVDDSALLYQWLTGQTRAPIYLWGHGYGAAIATHTIAILKKLGAATPPPPTGLFLECPFTNLADELPHHPLVKPLAWLVWYEATVARPLAANGYAFKTDEHLLAVDCPILIVQTGDNGVVPAHLSEKLYKIGEGLRDRETQGAIAYHLYPGDYGYGHERVYEARELPEQISDHIAVCEAFKKKKQPRRQQQH